MKTVTLEWVQTSYSNLEEMEDCHFYALSRGSSVLYIGMTYQQYVQNEVKQTLREFDLSEIGLTIWLGYIQKMDFGRITKQIVQDVECLLIFAHQPTYNEQCKSSYTGRDVLRVKNRECPHLKPSVEVKGDYVYC